MAGVNYNVRNGSKYSTSGNQGGRWCQKFKFVHPPVREADGEVGNVVQKKLQALSVSTYKLGS